MAQFSRERVRLLRFTFSGEQVVELGGGAEGRVEFHPNLDVRKGKEVDIIASFEYPLPLKSGIFDGVFSRFAIEHISPGSVPQFIAEIYRILKPTGKAIVATMDLKAIVDRLAKLEHWEINDIEVIFRGDKYPESLHRCGFSPELLHRLFTEAGFKTIRFIHFYMGDDTDKDYWTDMLFEVWKSPVELQPFEEEFPPFYQEEANVIHSDRLYELPFREGGTLAELGGGDRPLFHPNVDVRPSPTVDIVADFEKPLPLESGAYDGIYCGYVIEHLSWRTVKGFIAELYRILKPNGIAVLVTANLLEQARVLVNKEHWEEYDIGMVFGGQDYPENTHRNGFSPAYAARLFFEQSFYEVKIVPLPWCPPDRPTDMIIEARKSGARIRFGLPIALIPLEGNRP